MSKPGSEKSSSESIETTNCIMRGDIFCPGVRSATGNKIVIRIIESAYKTSLWEEGTESHVSAESLDTRLCPLSFPFSYLLLRICA